MNEPDNAMIGRQLGNYTLVRLLGRGGFASVYLAENVHIQTKVAIKVLHTQIARDEIAHFREEARTIAGLKHPHIVQLLDFGVDTDGGTPYLIMSYAPNGSLRNLHRSGESVPLPTVVSYVRQVADALQFAHDRRVVHCDVKPENILLNEQNELLLTDFGIALVVQTSRQQSTKDIAGTFAYMAPEHAQGKPTLASDQYALGIMTYEWLVGKRPFHGGMVELIGQHQTVPPPSLRAQNPTLPAAVEEVVQRALAKNPQDRFSNVKAFADALEQASKGYTEQFRPTEIKQPSAHTRPPVNTQGHPAVGTQQRPVDPTQYAAMNSGPGPLPTLPANTWPSQTDPRRSTTSGRGVVNTGQRVPPNMTPPPPPYQSYPGGYAPLPTYPPPVPYVAVPVRRKSSTGRVLLIVCIILAVVVVSCGGFTAFFTALNKSMTNRNQTAASTPGSVPATLGTDSKTLYAADWSKNFNHWTVGSEWKWVQSNIVGSDGGQGEQDYSENPHDYFLVAPYRAPSADYEVDVQIQYLHSASSSSGDFGLVLRSDQNGNGYFCGFDVNYGQYDIALMQYGGYGDLSMTSLTENSNSYGNSITMDNQYHTYSARVNKNVITLLVDGKQVAQVTDNTYLSTGLIGLRSYSTVVDVHSFRVEKL